MKNLRFVLLGAFFGLVLTKSEVVTWHKIRAMFHFREPDLYLIIGSAVVVGAVLVAIVKRLKPRTPYGEPVVVERVPMHKGVFFGGFLFGVGWYIAGTCPGPIYAQLGGGEFFAVFTLLGALAGAYAFAWAKPKLPD
ncbi:MAG TPA: DUF6691 family protein [Fibrobacteria bacterium]|nr:DUF6691 family protein [Fibrobacteria bacterium]